MDDHTRANIIRDAIGLTTNRGVIPDEYITMSDKDVITMYESDEPGFSSLIQQVLESRYPIRGSSDPVPEDIQEWWMKVSDLVDEKWQRVDEAQADFSEYAYRAEQEFIEGMRKGKEQE